MLDVAAEAVEVYRAPSGGTYREVSAALGLRVRQRPGVPGRRVAARRDIRVSRRSRSPRLSRTGTMRVRDIESARCCPGRAPERGRHRSCLVGPRARSRSDPRAVDPRRSQVRPGFAHFDYVNPQRAQGRQRHAGRRPAPSTTSTPSSSRACRGAGHRRRSSTRSRPPRGRAGLASTAWSPRRSRCRRTARGWRSSCAPEARFHDGSPITAEDVIWTFDTLRTQGPAALPRRITRGGQRREDRARAACGSPSSRARIASCR